MRILLIALLWAFSAKRISGALSIRYRSSVPRIGVLPYRSYSIYVRRRTFAFAYASILSEFSFSYCIRYMFFFVSVLILAPFSFSYWIHSRAGFFFIFRCAFGRRWASRRIAWPSRTIRRCVFHLGGLSPIRAAIASGLSMSSPLGQCVLSAWWLRRE